MTTTDEALAASRRLDELLRKPIEPTMPELGGRKFAGQFGGLLGDLKKQVEQAIIGAQMEIAAAGAELVTELEAGKRQVVRGIKQETDAVRRAYSDMLGNGPPEDTAGAEDAPAKPAATPEGQKPEAESSNV